MAEIKELAIPIIVAVVSAIVTALATIKIKYASSETDAISGLKRLGETLIFYCWIAWLIYSLGKQAISSDPVTRGAVFSIAIYTASLAVLLVMHFVRRIVGILEKMTAAHLDITHRVISLQAPEQVTSNKAGAAAVVEHASD